MTARAAIVAVAAFALAGCGGVSSTTPPTPNDVQTLAPTVELTQRPAAGTGVKRSLFTTAHVQRTTALRSAPGGKVLSQVKTHTEFGSPMILSVAKQDGDWLKVHSAALPNGADGWIARADTKLGGTDYQLVVHRDRHMVSMRRGGKTVFSFPIAVGRPGNETPLGHFAVTDKIEAEPGSAYGIGALALTGHQTKIEPGWPGGDRLAIHGTPDEWTVGKAVSLGCMRAYEPAVRKLMQKIPLGTPVTIQAS